MSSTLLKSTLRLPAQGLALRLPAQGSTLRLPAQGSTPPCA